MSDDDHQNTYSKFNDVYKAGETNPEQLIMAKSLVFTNSSQQVIESLPHKIDTTENNDTLPSLAILILLL